MSEASSAVLTPTEYIQHHLTNLQGTFGGNQINLDSVVMGWGSAPSCLVILFLLSRGVKRTACRARRKLSSSCCTTSSMVR